LLIDFAGLLALTRIPVAQTALERASRRSVYGGAPPQSGACDALSAHGYLGKESETVEQIVNWMLKKPFLHEVK